MLSSTAAAKENNDNSNMTSTAAGRCSRMNDKEGTDFLGTTTTTTTTTRTVERWICDVCKECAFLTMEEAVAHEQQCQAATQQPAVAPAAAPAPLHPFFQTKSSKEAAAPSKTVARSDQTRKRKTADPPKMEAPPPRTSKRTRTATTKTTTKAPKETSAPVVADLHFPPQHSKSSSTAVAKHTKKKARTTADLTATATTTKNKARKAVDLTAAATSTKRKAKKTVDLTAAATTKTKAKKAVDVTPPTTSASSNKRAAPRPKQSQLPWSAIATVDPALLAEQRMAEFQAQRRLKAAHERERQLKRQQHGLGGSAPITLAAGPAAGVPSPNVAAVRFPQPSHVWTSSMADSVGNENTSATTGSQQVGSPWLTPEDLAQMNDRWRREITSSSSTTTDVNSPDENLVRLFLPSSCSNEVVVPLDSSSLPPTSLLLDSLLASCLIPHSRTTATETTSNTTTTNSCGPRPMQSIPDDCCGASLKSAAEAILPWVQEWKQVRQRCLAHMAEKQRKRAGQHKKLHKQKTPAPRKRPKYQDDDDFLSSDNDDDDDDVCGLPALCLLTGPIGCGKSDLVRAVAAVSDCPLLEINPNKKRGAAALKKAVGEATQSHADWKAIKATTPFSSLVNSDNEADDNDTKVGSSLTVILLDEVDNLYEGHGDNGFWTALSELSKAAKCPIFLTANSFPEPLASSSFHFKHVPIEAPTPTECVPWLRQQPDCCWTDRATDSQLEQVASLCHCDLRKMAYELQSFSYRSVIKTDANEVGQKDATDDDDGDDGDCVTSGDPPLSEPERRPVGERVRVQSVTPRGVRSTEHALLSISGTHFLSLAEPSELGKKDGYPVHVFVGDQLCPQSRIMNDSTILAVCPPHLPPPSGVKKSSGAVGQRHLSLAYSSIRVCGLRKTGLLSDSASVLDEPVDGISLPSVAKPVYLERHFPGSIECHLLASSESTTPMDEKDEESDEEFEFTDQPQASTLIPPLGSPFASSPEQDGTIAARVLKEGIDAWCSRHETPPEPGEFVLDGNHGSVEDMERACYQRDLVSDAAMLEDVAMFGTPFLAGSARGFGYDLTDAFSRCTNDKNKRPSEDALFSSGWKDDAGFFGSSDSYMTLPFTSRERALLMRSESSTRGFSFPEASAANDEAQDTDSNFSPVELGDEECFLPNPVPKSLLSLPPYLRRHGAFDENASKACLDYQMSCETATRRKEMFRWIHSHIFALQIRKNQQIIFDLDRRMDPLLPSLDTMDRRFWLDYLPMIRCMVVLDQAGAGAYQTALTSQDDELASAMSNRKRRTRQSQNKGFSYYMEKLVPEAIWRSPDQAATPKDLVVVMGQYAMRY